MQICPNQRALWDVSGVEAGRVLGRTGVWVGQRKLAAIGIRARGWTTFHGLALNVCPDLAPFGKIVPCGISDAGVGSVWNEVHGADLTPSGGGGTEEKQQQQQQKAALMTEYAIALQESLAELLGISFTDVGLELP